MAWYLFFSISGPLLPWGPAKGPEGLACCCLVACLLDAHAPPQWSNTLMNRPTYYVLQLGDPYPYPYPYPCPYPRWVKRMDIGVGQSWATNLSVREKKIVGKIFVGSKISLLVGEKSFVGWGKILLVEQNNLSLGTIFLPFWPRAAALGS